MKRAVSILLAASLAFCMNTAFAQNKAATVAQTTNLTWMNTGDITGDQNGPCYSSYSKIGYGKASAIIRLSQAQCNLARKADGKTASAFIFLGVNIYDKRQQWESCVDAGIGKTGDGKWHAVMNCYMPSGNQPNWWESAVTLNDTHDYKLEEDTTKKDGQITLNIYDLTDGNKLVDSYTKGIYFSKKDSSNMAIYQECSVAFADDLCRDTKGNYTTDYAKVVLYNTNQNIFLKNVKFEKVTISSPKKSTLWTSACTNTRWMWPEKATKMPYAIVKVRAEKKDYERIVDIDLNH